MTHKQASQLMKKHVANSISDILYIDGSQKWVDQSVLHLMISKIVEKYGISNDQLQKMLSFNEGNEKIQSLASRETLYHKFLSHWDAWLNGYISSANFLMSDVFGLINKRSVHVLLDNTSWLDISNTVMCNRVLYSRGGVWATWEHSIYLKINDTLWDWKTYRFFDKYVQSTHDYKSRCVDNYVFEV